MGDGPVRARVTHEAGADARALIQALSPEAGREVPKTHTKISLVGTDVVLDVTADDARAMRAALNSYLRWAALAIDSSKLAKGD